MNHDTYPDDILGGILKSVRTIAVVGASDDERRPSNRVMRFLVEHGYVVLGVNPKLRPDAIPGVPVYPSLADLPCPVDMVDVFRANPAIPGVIAEVLALDPLPAVVWMQIGVRVDAEAARAEERGLRVIMDRCPKIEHARLFGLA